MNARTTTVGAILAVGTLALSACGTGADAQSSEDQLSVVGFSILEAANEPVFEAFNATEEGADVSFQTSYGASGDQSRAVEGGLNADVVHLSLEPDMDRLVESGDVAEDWNTGETAGITTSSVVAFVVREGNPENIQGWEDLVRPGVEIITPNPASSGSAKWNILGAWAHVSGAGGTEAEARDFVTRFLNNTISLPSSARDATSTFSSGSGDVLISYENEAILARQGGEAFDYVVPDDTLLIENPAAVVEGSPAAAGDLLEFLTSPEAQAEYAAFGFRPIVDGVELPEVEGANDPGNPFPEPGTLYTVGDTFNGWDEANDKFFAEETGIIPQLQAQTGTEGEE